MNRATMLILFSAGLAAGVGTVVSASALAASSDFSERLTEVVESADLVLPFEAVVTDANGRRVSGQFQVSLRVIDESDGDMVLYSRDYGTVELDDGALLLKVPLSGSSDSGMGLTPAVLAERAENDLAFEVTLDGTQLGTRAEAVDVPFSLATSNVSAANVSYGGKFGYIRSSLVERNILVETGYVRAGGELPAPTATGFTNCEVSLTPMSGGPALDYYPDEFDADTRAVFYAPFYGCGTQQFDGLGLTFPLSGGCTTEAGNTAHLARVEYAGGAPCLTTGRPVCLIASNANSTSSGPRFQYMQWTRICGK